MKNYIIKTIHEIEIDEHQNGLTKHVNSYSLDSKIEAENPREAIQKYFDTYLYYNFTFANAYMPHEEDEDEDKNTLFYDVLVDEESQEPTETDIKKWKKGEKILYNNNIHLSIYELKPATI